MRQNQEFVQVITPNDWKQDSVSSTITVETNKAAVDRTVTFGTTSFDKTEIEWSLSDDDIPKLWYTDDEMMAMNRVAHEQGRKMRYTSAIQNAFAACIEADSGHNDAAILFDAKQKLNMSKWGAAITNRLGLDNLATEDPVTQMRLELRRDGVEAVLNEQANVFKSYEEKCVALCRRSRQFSTPCTLFAQCLADAFYLAGDKSVNKKTTDGRNFRKSFLRSFTRKAK